VRGCPAVELRTYTAVPVTSLLEVRASHLDIERDGAFQASSTSIAASPRHGRRAQSVGRHVAARWPATSSSSAAR
jgi:hypothetical protein